SGPPRGLPPTFPDRPPGAGYPEPRPNREGSPARAASPGPRFTMYRSTADARSSGGLGITRQRIGMVEIVSLTGRMSESFQGAELGRSLSGSVVLDLAGIERVTSFGVREWLQLLKEAEPRCASLHLARCSEAVVTQLTTIRGFAGKGAVVSLFAPYHCTGCGAMISALVDAEHDAEAIRDRTPPEVACPRCSSQATFDDDPASYFAVSGALVQAVPAEVRAAVAALAQRGVAEAVEKTIEGRTTRIRIRLPLDPSLRWRRILDGVEGQVLLDLSHAPAGSRDGAIAVRQAMQSLSPDVDVVRIEGCPPLVLGELYDRANRQLERIEVVTALVEGQCDSCGTRRPATIDLTAEATVLLAGEDPVVPCRRCGQPLSFAAHRGVLRRAIEARSPHPPASAPGVPPAYPASTGRSGGSAEGAHPWPTAIPGTPPPAPQVTYTAMPEVPRSNALRSMGTYLAVGIGSAGRAALVVTFVLLTAWGGLVGAPSGPPAPEPAPAEAAHGWSTDDGLPPAWSERPVALDADALTVVGHGAPTGSEDEALALARVQAIAQLLGQVATDLRGQPVHAFLESRGAPTTADAFGPAAVARYEAQLGAVAGLARVAVAFRRSEAGIDAVAQYRLDRAAYDGVVAEYRRTASFGGMTVARLFPGLTERIATDGDLVVIGADRRPARTSGLVVGDVLLGIDGDRIRTIDDADRVGQRAWDATAPGASLAIDVESNGAPRTVRFTRPLPASDR
ncbi:MAG: hypothetical protein ABMB14_28280, partial [Myxococcota bacterium]